MIEKWSLLILYLAIQYLISCFRVIRRGSKRDNSIPHFMLQSDMVGVKTWQFNTAFKCFKVIGRGQNVTLFYFTLGNWFWLHSQVNKGYDSSSCKICISNFQIFRRDLGHALPKMNKILNSELLYTHRWAYI